MSSYPYHKLDNFGEMIYTVGDGVDGRSATALNKLSKANALVAAEIARKRDTILFIAGGNSGTKYGRTLPIEGSLTEAERMAREI
jgi:hypothetical protein